MEVKKLIIFDFCETLVNIQTADNFVLWVLDKEKVNSKFQLDFIRRLKKIKFITILNLLFPRLNFEKRLLLRLLRNLSQETINENAKNYAQWLKGKWTLELKDLFMMHIDKRDQIIVISGGYEIYLKHFFAEFPEVVVFGTKIEFKNGKLTGEFEGKDCMFQEKVKILNSWIETSGYNKENSVVFSDSISDLPLLKWANEGFVVSHKKEQNWAKMNNLKEIIWGQKI